MAAPKCSDCGHDFFAGTDLEAIGLKQRVTMVHCARCGTVYGVMDCQNMNDAVIQLQEKLEDLEFKLNYLIK